MINFYKHRALKKYRKDEDDPQLEVTGIPIDTRILLCGGSGSGKTNCLANYFAHTSSVKKGTFHHVYLVHKTDEMIYNWMADVSGEHISFFKNVRDLPSVDEFADLDKSKDRHRYLVVFDDVVADTARPVIEKINAFFQHSRKKGITCVYLSQSYYSTQKFIRANTDVVALCGIRSVRDLQAICREYNTGADVTQMQRMYAHATSEPLRPLIVFTGTTPPGRKFSAGLNNWLNPADFA